MQRAHFQSWTVFGFILALGMVLGGGVAYYFFARQVSALNDLLDTLQNIEVPTPAAADTPIPPPKPTGKNHGQH